MAPKTAEEQKRSRHKTSARAKKSHDKDQKTIHPPDSENFFEVRSYLQDLEEAGQWRELLAAIEEHLKILYYKERFVEDFFEKLLLHRRCFTTLRLSGDYEEYLAQRLRAAKVPGVFAAMTGETERLIWNGEFFKNRALASEKKGQLQEALDYCDLMLRVGGQSSQAYLIKGRVLENLEEFDAAGDSYKRAIELDDSNYSAYHRLAIRFTEKSPEIAMTYIDRALDIHPASAAIIATKARIYREMREYQKAVELFEEAIRVSSDNAFYIYEKAQLLEKTGQPAEAVSHYRRAIQLDAKLSGAYYALAGLLEQSQPDWALVYMNEAVKLCPEDVEMLYRRAALLELLGETAEAVEEYAKVVALEPSHHQAHFQRGFLLRQENPLEASVSFGKAAALVPEDGVYQMHYARALMETGREGDAARAFERAVQLDPVNDEAWYFWGSLLVKKNPQQALECFEKASSLDPARALYIFQRGLLLLEWKKEPEAALECFDTAAQMDPNSAQFRLHLAMSLDAAGRPASAVENYKEALRMGGPNAVACSSLALLLFQSEPTAALDYIDTALELEPANSEYYFLKANLLFATGVRTGAIRAKKAVEQEHTPMLMDEGDPTRLLAEANPEDVLRYLDKAVRLSPKNSDYYRARGTIFASLGSNRRALEQYRKALRLNSRNHMAYFGTAQLVSQKYRDKALPLYDRAIALAPHVAEYPARKAEALLCEPPDFEKAMACYEAALDILPADPNLLLYKAQLLEKLGNLQEAMEFYRRAVLVNDKCAPASGRLGYLMTSFQPENALEHLQKAIELERENIDYSLWAARAMDRLGDSAGAQAYYTHVLEIRGDTPETRCEIASLLAEVAPQAALEHIERALVEDTKNPEYLLKKGEILGAMGRSEEALALFEKLAQKYGADPRPMVSAAKLLYSFGDAASLGKMDRAVLAAPRSSDILAIRSEMRLALADDLDGALADIAAAVRRRPRSLAFRERYVKLLERKGSRLLLFFERQRVLWQRRQVRVVSTLQASSLLSNAGRFPID
ncbi:tetratricopeptide repeat protein [Oscillospiraceae bacterium MB08-C2-2]|nr:tetratricopeptide repeat protein [Oscillospiraceae bacterium MB08-C2-2]